MRLMRTLIGLSSIALSTYALGGEWTRDASISVGSYYSDNICLVPGDVDEEGKAAATVTPRIDVRGGGGRSKTSLQAAVEYNSIGDSSLECPPQGGGLNRDNREPWVPRINFLSEFEALEDLFYLEADAYAAQNPVNPFSAGGDDNINATGNTNITYRWGVGGRVQRQLNQEWAVFARYNYNEQYNSLNQVLGDSQEDLVEVDIGKIPGASRFSYGLRGEHREVFFEDTVTAPEFTNRLSRAEFRTALQINRTWQVNGYVGEEDNIFVSDAEEIDGSFWDVGLQWSPNARVTVDIGTGERFFGSTPRFNVSYRHKRSELRLGYLRDFRFPRNIRASDSGVDPSDAFAPGVGLPGDSLVNGGDQTFIGQSPLLDERFTLQYLFTGRQVNVIVSASDSMQTRASDGRVGDFSFISLSIRRQLARRLSADLGVRWQKNEGDGDDFDEGGQFQDLEVWRASFGIERSLSSKTSVTARYQYSDQTSTQANNNFVENLVEISLNHSF